jgi:hypothetical protein
MRTADLSNSSNAFVAFAAQDLRQMMYDALRHPAITGLAGLDRVAWRLDQLEASRAVITVAKRIWRGTEVNILISDLKHQMLSRGATESD